MDDITSTPSEALESNLSDLDQNQGLDTPDTSNSAQKGSESSEIPSFEEWLAKQDPKSFEYDDEDDAPAEPKAKEKEEKPSKKEAKETESEEKGKSTSKSKDDKPEATKPAEKPAEPRKFKLKIDGEEREYGEEEVISLAQKAKAADERFAQASKLQKQAEQVVAALKGNLGMVLEKAGVTREALDKYYYETYIEPETMDPAQYAALKQQRADAQELERLRQAEADRRKAEEEDTRKAQEKADAEARAKAVAEQKAVWSKRISEGLQSVGLPQNEYTVTRMAAHIRSEHARGIQDIQVKELALKVKDEFIESQKQTISRMSAKELRALLGEDAVEKLRELRLEELKPKFENRNPSQGKVREVAKPRKRYSSPQQILDDLK